jgi:acyl carrier protein
MSSSNIQGSSFNFTPDCIGKRCAEIFREAISLSHPIHIEGWDDGRLLAEPLEAIDVDSLTLLELVMRVEDAYGIELNEAAVNDCRTIGELVTLVTAATHGSRAPADSPSS